MKHWVFSAALFLGALMALPSLAFGRSEDRSATIAASGTTSGEVDISHFCLVGIDMPSGWDAADITFTASHASGGTFDPVTDGDGTAVTITVAASKYIDLTKTGEQICGADFIKIVSSQTQTAERILLLKVAN